MPDDILHGLFFYPRGGSAQVIRYLSAAMIEQGASCRVVAGSLGEAGDRSYAPSFFREVPVIPIDYSPAVAAYERGEDPLRHSLPLHPSFEDRSDVPDRIFAAVDPEIGEHIERAWVRLLAEGIERVPDLFHLHHLTPLQHAVRVNWPRAAVIGHLHGTELFMLEMIRDRGRLAEKLGLDLQRDAERIPAVAAEMWEQLSDDEREIVESTRWEFWRYGEHWDRRLRHYASLCDRLIVLSVEARDSAARLLDFDPDLIHAIPNGVDVSRFQPARLSNEERLARWRHWLAEEPRGWDESGVAGSIRYSTTDVDRWFGATDGEHSPVLMFVGRFVNIKRVPLLIRAYKRAQPQFQVPAPLVIWGGSPGEWEGEHPVSVVRNEAVEGVFFVGWRGHEELPYGLNAADVMVAPSTNEPFGQVYLEAMACGLPVIGTLSGGPPSFVNTDADAPNGWLVPPDDEVALAEALVEAVNNAENLRAKGRNAVRSVQEQYSWQRIARTFQEIYNLAIAQEEALTSSRQPNEDAEG